VAAPLPPALRTQGKERSNIDYTLLGARPKTRLTRPELAVKLSPLDPEDEEGELAVKLPPLDPEDKEGELAIKLSPLTPKKSSGFLKRIKRIIKSLRKQKKASKKQKPPQWGWASCEASSFSPSQLADGKY